MIFVSCFKKYLLTSIPQTSYMILLMFQDFAFQNQALIYQSNASRENGLVKTQGLTF